MADKTVHSKKTQNNDLSLTGKPVLVQNELGIFYGFLEKSDTRSGTALLRDGFKISPELHITYTQYLDFLSYEISERYWEAEDKYDYQFSQQDEDEDFEPSPPPDSDDVIPNEILINQDVFDEHRRSLSISDYASEGIYLLQRRTSSHENSNQLQYYTPLISLTGIEAIVAISEKTLEHQGLNDTKEEIEKRGLIDEVALYFNNVSPMISFALVDKSLENIIKLLASTKYDLARNNSDFITPTNEYMANLLLRDTESYINPKIITKDKTIRDFANEFLLELTRAPSIVINSKLRMKLYDNKAQQNEQN